MTPDPVAVGLAGAGHWAYAVHAPVFAGGRETRLAGVWSRSRARAEELAGAYGCRRYADFDDLVAASEAVSLAVSPDAQPALAGRAAQAGRHVLLEKPVATCVDDAVSLAQVLAGTRAGSLLFLTYRFSPLVRSFLRRCQSEPPARARLRFLTTARPDAISGWRREHGLLLDLGFHVFDLLDGAAGPIESVTARGDVSRSVTLRVEHAGGCVSDAIVSWAGLPARRTDLEIWAGREHSSLDPAACVRGPWLPAGVRAAVWQLVRGGDAMAAGIERGLYLQRCVAVAERALACPGEPAGI